MLVVRYRTTLTEHELEGTVMIFAGLVDGEGCGTGTRATTAWTPLLTERSSSITPFILPVIQVQTW